MSQRGAHSRKRGVAVVTGGARGIGLATAKHFCGLGLDIALIDNDGERVLQAEAEVEGPGNVIGLCADVSDEGQISEVFSEVEAQLGNITVLVNCAAVFLMEDIEATPATWHRVLAVNVVGSALCAKYAARTMRRQRQGNIVNVASISAHIAQPKFLTYSASKAAVLALTRGLALDLGPFGIRVNAVSPGTTWSESNAEFQRTHRGLDREAADRHPDLGGRHILNRCADPEEIASAIAFLATADASFVTGQTLLVDGGYTSV